MGQKDEKYSKIIRFPPLNFHHKQVLLYYMTLRFNDNIFLVKEPVYGEFFIKITIYYK